MTAHELTDSFYLHDSSLIMITRSADTGVRELSLTIDDKTEELPERTVFADLPGVFDAEILEAKPLSDQKLLLCLFLTKKDEQVYAELNVTADDFYPEVTI